MTFWLFLAVVAAAAFYSDVQGKKQRAELLRIAMEKGQALDPALIERLFPLDDDKRPHDPRSWRRDSILFASVGFGLGLLSLALRQFSDRAFWIVLGIGGLALVVAVGLFVVSLLPNRDPLPAKDGDLRL